MKASSRRVRAFIKYLKHEFRHFSIWNLVLLTIAGCINAVGVVCFLAPVNLYDSGISGTSMLLWQVTPERYTLSLFLIILNVPLFLFGMKKQGYLFTLYAMWAVACYSGMSYLITNVFPISVDTASPFAGNDLLLCAAFGGLISGIGSGLTIRFGGAIDGIEVLAVIFAKRLNMTVGTFVMIYNVVLYLIIGFVYGSWTLPLYSIIAYTVAIKSVDFIVDGLDKAKSTFVVTEKPDEVSAAISKAFGRGVTQMEAFGFYSQREKKMIYFVLNRFQVAKLKEVVHRVDPEAFITISDVSDVFGNSIKEDMNA